MEPKVILATLPSCEVGMTSVITRTPRMAAAASIQRMPTLSMRIRRKREEGGGRREDGGGGERTEDGGRRTANTITFAGRSVEHRRDLRGRVGRRSHRNHLELHQVGPLAEPRVQGYGTL